MLQTTQRFKTYSVLYSFETEFIQMVKPYSTYFFTKSKKEDRFKIYNYKLQFKHLKEELDFTKKLREFETRHKTEIMRILSNVEIKESE